MNAVRCPKCGFANAADLNFCTNCGTALPATAPSTLVQTSAAVSPQPIASSPVRATGGRNLAIFGGLGCIALALGGVALFAVLYYIGSSVNNADRANADAVVNVNRQTAVRADVNSEANVAVTGGDDEQPSASEQEMRNLMPPQIGAFGRMGSAVKGDGDDFVNAKTILKATYAKNSKQLLNVVDAEFADAKAAETAYTIFLYGTRVGAKIIKQQKIKDARGIEGDSAVYTFKQDGKTLYEAMFYGGQYAFRFTAPDQATLTEFLTAFGEHSQKVSR